MSGHHHPQQWYLYSDGDNYVPPTVTHLVIASNTRDIPSSLCATNQCLREVWFQPNSNCRAIGTSAFYACTNLELVHLAPTVRLIGFLAFHECPNLRIVRIESDCPQQTTQTITTERKFGVGFQCFKNACRLTEVSIVEGVRTISEACFQGCSSLRTMSLPKTIEHVMKKSFYYCTSLEFVLLNDGLRTIGDEAFYHCENLKAMPVPSSVERIGAKAFAFCTKLENVELHTGLKSIVQEAFAHCENLQSIPIPNTVESIGSRAFENCTMLYSVELEMGSQLWLGDDIFRGCTNLIWIALATSPYKRFYNRFHLDTETLDPLDELHPSRDQKTVLSLAGERLDGMEWYCVSDHDRREQDEMELVQLQKRIQKYGLAKSFHTGINIFHIMASAKIPRHNLFHALLDRLPIRLLFQQDKIGLTPLMLLADNPSSQAHELLLSLIPKLVTFSYIPTCFPHNKTNRDEKEIET